MRILVVATKLPWPAIDGGRLVLWHTVAGLLDAGHEVCLIAPTACGEGVGGLGGDDRLQTHAIQVAPRSRLRIAIESLWHHSPLTVVRHCHARLRDAVAQAIADFVPDVVHAEQLQAVANCDAAHVNGVPVVLRMQNVESDLWAQSAAAGLRMRALAFEAERVRRAERDAMQRCAATVTLTVADADRLRALLPEVLQQSVRAIAPPFAPALATGPAVAGAPALVISGSAGWRPNAFGAQWFSREIWPTVREQVAGARLHMFGGTALTGDGVEWHAAPADSVTAFPVGAIVVVPLAVASGIRMRILEAWARGLPVIATTAAARGLVVRNGDELMIADNAADFSSAIARLADDSALRQRLVQRGRDYLRDHHDAAQATAALLAVYRSVAARTAP